MHVAIDTRSCSIEPVTQPALMGAGLVRGDGGGPRTATLDEPSHIHIPRPSRVMRPAAEAAPFDLSEPREAVDASGVAEV